MGTDEARGVAAGGTIPRAMLRRLPRILLSAATAVPLVLCVIALFLLVANQVAFEIPLLKGGRWAITSAHGRLSLGNRPEFRRWESQVQSYREARDRAYRDYLERREIDPGTPPPPQREPPAFPDAREFGSFRYLPAAGVTGTLALVLYLGHCASQKLRRDRRATGHCVGCGYDLRATPGRCPECGRAAAAPPAPRR
jgi:hypothetical protein